MEWIKASEKPKDINQWYIVRNFGLALWVKNYRYLMTDEWVDEEGNKVKDLNFYYLDESTPAQSDLREALKEILEAVCDSDESWYTDYQWDKITKAKAALSQDSKNENVSPEEKTNSSWPFVNTSRRPDLSKLDISQAPYNLATITEMDKIKFSYETAFFWYAKGAIDASDGELFEDGLRADFHDGYSKFFTEDNIEEAPETGEKEGINLKEERKMGYGFAAEKDQPLSDFLPSPSVSGEEEIRSRAIQLCDQSNIAIDKRATFIRGYEACAAQLKSQLETAKACWGQEMEENQKLKSQSSKTN